MNYSESELEDTSNAIVMVLLHHSNRTQFVDIPLPWKVLLSNSHFKIVDEVLIKLMAINPPPLPVLKAVLYEAAPYAIYLKHWRTYSLYLVSLGVEPNYRSERGYQLLAQSAGTEPIVTLENYEKWVGVYVIHPDATVTIVPTSVLEAAGAYTHGWQVDHYFHPKLLHALSVIYQGSVDIVSLEVAAGRWAMAYRNDDYYGGYFVSEDYEGKLYFDTLNDARERLLEQGLIPTLPSGK